jgi:PAS domain S-box-containing protein
VNTLQKTFEQSTDAIFGIDVTGVVRFANSTLERLLGYPGEKILGTQCASLLCGTDLHGNAFCGKNCPIPKTIEGRPPGNDFDLVVKRADGESVLVNIGACYSSRQLREQSGEVSVFFSLRKITSQRLLRRLSTHASTASARDRANLTSREREILELASNGLKTRQIANRLCISSQTVRSHFKNIYPKIGVHSRTEAVVYALRQQLA